MGTLITNLPAQQVYVRKEYLRNLENGDDRYGDSDQFDYGPEATSDD
jgi:hypothetical protein